MRRLRVDGMPREFSARSETAVLFLSPHGTPMELIRGLERLRRRRSGPETSRLDAFVAEAMDRHLAEATERVLRVGQEVELHQLAKRNTEESAREVNGCQAPARFPRDGTYAGPCRLSCEERGGCVLARTPSECLRRRAAGSSTPRKRIR